MCGVKLGEEQKEFIKQNKLEDFKDIEICESYIDTKNQIEKLEISKLYGNSGEIGQSEIKNMQKFFVNLV